MSKKIDPDLFARLMGLPQPARNDLLEFLGETPVAEAELERLIEDAANKDGPLKPT
ncbi:MULTISPECIES: hypothetical protein [Paracoccaceae]|jgi:hypothetical protein|uniref:hypothetical protein n=1 Tax=Rhodobacterales TaxID=204455 RepID=UPI001B2053F1|nr:hypothetical protein [Boseongicola sp. H5]MBO6604140.1 hypothetical protein [Roseicyclus sp.]MBO6625325.1 hypothetical protein [Roseicyclus sp.]MBO6922706.1 hypothetical protein [Roseicyclus sp.]